MSKTTDFNEILNDGIRTCPVTYTGRSGKVYEFEVAYRPEAFGPHVLIAFEQLDAAYKELEEARAAGRESNAKVDLATTSRILALLISDTGQTLKGEPIPSTEEFFLKTSYEFQSAIIQAVIEDHNRPTTGSSNPSQDSFTGDQSTGLALSVTE